jgi:hypothetical protein
VTRGDYERARKELRPLFRDHLADVGVDAASRELQMRQVISASMLLECHVDIGLQHHSVRVFPVSQPVRLYLMALSRS